MKELSVEEKAKRFVDLLCDAEQPEIRCHPNQVEYAQKIVDKMLTIRPKLWKKIPVKLVVDDWVQDGVIYAMDAQYFGRDPREILKMEEPDLRICCPFKYDFSWLISSKEL